MGAPNDSGGHRTAAAIVYALGATLYELLTLQSAFDGTDQLRLIDRIVNERPKPPRQLDGHVPRDLETIVLRAMAKDPKDRFGTAREMAEELRRFVAGHPIRSRPVSIAERFWRWCKRDPWLAGSSVAAAVLAAVLVLGLTSAAFVYKTQIAALEQEKSRTSAASLDAKRRTVDAYIAQADAGRFSRRSGQRFASLKAIGEASRMLASWASEDNEEARRDVATRRDKLRDLAIAALALPDIRVGKSMGPKPANSSDFVEVDPAFRRYVMPDHSGNCIMYRAGDGAELARFPNLGPANNCWPIFGPDGRSLAALPRGRTTPAMAARRARSRSWWSTSLRGESRSPEPRASGPTGRRYYTRRPTARSGSSIDAIGARAHPATGGRRGPSSWPSTPTAEASPWPSRTPGSGSPGRERWTTSTPTASLDLPTSISYIAWSPDGRRLAMAGDDSRITVWEPRATGPWRSRWS